jgi:unsaturated rhamnogalacturonyl hydrolase
MQAEARAVAERIFERVRREDPVWGNYTIDLTFDAMLERYLATGDVTWRDYVFSVMYRRNIQLQAPISYQHEPFGQLSYSLYRASGDPLIADAFIDQSVRYLREVERSPDGLVLHRAGAHAEPRVLVDSMQGYVSRMARTSALTGDDKYLAEAVTQIRLHRNLLQRADRLWCQGRGWEPTAPLALSPGAWSRGQGWILRGLTDTLNSMSGGHPGYQEVHAYTQELIDALLPLQDSAGMWHVLLHLPCAESTPETSGTALIAAALYRLLNGGHLEGSAYRSAADRALAAVLQRVDGDGRVRGACVGPGPLNQALLEDRYRQQTFAEDEYHGRFAVLYACSTTP